MTNVFSDEVPVYNKAINAVAGIFILLMILISIGNLFNDTLASYIPGGLLFYCCHAYHY